MTTDSTPPPEDAAAVDGLLDDEPQAVREALKRRLKSEGVQVAYTAMLDVCRNPSAPAPARATCAATIFRAAGYLGKQADEDADDTPIEHMSAEQMIRELKRLQRKRRVLKRALEQPSDQESNDDPTSSVFD